jgi:hypothetical protein
MEMEMVNSRRKNKFHEENPYRQKPKTKPKSSDFRRKKEYNDYSDWIPEDQEYY